MNANRFLKKISNPEELSRLKSQKSLSKSQINRLNDFNTEALVAVDFIEDQINFVIETNGLWYSTQSGKLKLLNYDSISETSMFIDPNIQTKGEIHKVEILTKEGDTIILNCSDNDGFVVRRLIEFGKNSSGKIQA